MKKTKTKKVSIGGQAVLEGVMMRGSTAMATAVRDADGTIRVETKRLKTKKSPILKFPIIRGICAFIVSLFGGVKVLMRSADVYGEGEPTRFEKWLAKKTNIDVMSIVGAFALIIGLALAIVLFMFLPIEIRKLLERLFDVRFGIWAVNLIEGGLKLLVFISYILICSLLKDIRRTFMYHGAEHKTISCYEKGKELTVENVKTCTRIHDRCGTTFIILVMLISIITFACFESIVGNRVEGVLRILCKLLLLPIVAGISYEVLKGLSKTDLFIFYPFKLPGLLLQRITTREPDDKMIEVAIAAFNKVLLMDADATIKEERFKTPEKCVDLLKRVKDKLKDNGIEEDAEAEWILSILLNIKRDNLNTEKIISIKDIEKIDKIVEERITGRPLWYCIGDTEFYGYKIKVDERVLIPRPETEILVEKALSVIDSNSVVLDLCTGSGAIAVAVKKETGCKVCAVDISKDALSLARQNAVNLSLDIDFIESDLFNALEGKKFDVIITNPPYIKTDDIASLQREVKDFEPIIALDGGTDGLNFYRRIAVEGKKYLNDNGKIFMECGIDEANEIVKIFSDYKEVKVIKDYNNIDRIVMAVL